MAQKVTAMDIRMAAALAGQVDNVAEFCRREQISRQTFYKFRRRFREVGSPGCRNGPDGRLTSPGQTSAEVEELVLRRRKQLIEQGLDHGPQSIVWSLQRDGPAGGAVAVDGVADLDPPRGDHAAAAETAEVGDQTVLLRPAQRVLAVRLDRVDAGRRHRGGHRRHPR